MHGHHLATHHQAAAYAPAVDAIDPRLEAGDNLVFLSLQFQSPENGVVPEWILLIPAGRVVGRDGRSFVNDQPEQVLQAFRENKAPLPFDIEHATQIKGRQGEPAPAQGWIEELDIRDGAIWARVEWTEDGRELIATKQYRYFSPAMVVHGETQSLAKLLGAGLTNHPNLYLPALHRQRGASTHEESSMTKAVMSLAVLTALSLAETATEAEAVAAIKKLEEDRDTALHRAQVPDAEKFVPMATHKEILARAETAEDKLKTIEQQHAEEAIAEIIEQALDDGKIAPPDAPFYTDMCHTEGGLDKFRSFLETTPGVAPGQKDAGKDKKGGDQMQLNAEEKATAELLGISEEDFAKSKAEHAA